MLLDPGTPCSPVRLPAADEPGPAELAAVHARLRGVVDNWRWATELGLRLTTLEAAASDSILSHDGHVVYAADGAPVVLMLMSQVAAGIVRLSLGGSARAASADAASDLTATDLAVLDLWARATLESACGLLGIAHAAPRRVDRTALPPIADGWLLARLMWSGERPAGALMFAARLARPARQEHGPALADRPAALLDATVHLTARLKGPSVPLAELVGLEVGDVILLGPKTALQVALDAAGETIALGRPGVQGERMAVRVAWLSEALSAGPPITGRKGDSSDGR